MLTKILTPGQLCPGADFFYGPYFFRLISGGFGIAESRGSIPSIFISGGCEDAENAEEVSGASRQYGDIECGAGGMSCVNLVCLGNSQVEHLG